MSASTHSHFTRSKTHMNTPVYLTRLQANIRNEVAEHLAEHMYPQEVPVYTSPVQDKYAVDIDFDEGSRAWRANKIARQQGTFTYKTK